jgi:hypothetical protein
VSDYYEDEWYEDDYDDTDDWEDEPEGYSRDAYIYKAPNGQLATCEVVGVKWSGQDWGEADFSETWYRLDEIEDWIRELAIRLGRSMKPDTIADFPFWIYEPSDDGQPLCPDCFGELDDHARCLNVECGYSHIQPSGEGNSDPAS